MNELMDWFTPTSAWFLLGLVFFIAELVIPSFVLLFFGIGAWATMAVCLLFNIPIESQLILFSSASVFSLLVFRKKFQKWTLEKQNQDNNDELLSDFVGKKAIVTETVSPNGGRVHFNGSNWKAISEETITVNTSVVIINKKNITLFVKSN